MLFILWPLLPLTPAGGLFVWRALNLVGFGVALRVFGEQSPAWARILAVVTVHAFTLLVVGNMDGLILLGVALSWFAAQTRRPGLMGLGLWILSLKPHNILLFGLMTLVILWRWAWPERLRASAPLALSVVASFFIFGWDWPARYFANMQVVPPWPFIITTVWRAAAKLNLPVWWFMPCAGLALFAWGWTWWKYGPARPVLAVALATNLLFAAYAIEPHYVLLIPVFLWVSERHPWMALLAYGAAFGVYALRVSYGWDYVWLGVLYPLILFIGSWYAFISTAKSETPIR